MPLKDAYEILEPPYEHSELMRCSLWLALTNPHNYCAGATAVEYIKEGVGLNDTGTRCALAEWCCTALEFPGPEEREYRNRHAAMKACLDDGEINAAEIDAFTPACYEYNKWLAQRHGRGNTWLHVVCKHYWLVSGIELLLEYGAAAVINVRNGAGDTPLHCYLQRGFKHRPDRPALTGVRLLLDHGADPTLTKNAGQTPADITRAAPCKYADSQQHQRAILSELGEPAPA